MGLLEMATPEVSTWNPERRLLAAVLRCAVFDLMTENRLGGGWSGEDSARESARRWFLSDEDGEWYGSFRFVCQQLDISCQDFRRVLGEGLKSGLLKKRLNNRGRPRKREA